MRRLLFFALGSALIHESYLRYQDARLQRRRAVELERLLKRFDDGVRKQEHG